MANSLDYGAHPDKHDLLKAPASLSGNLDILK